MRTDPRKGCANERELLGWAILHDLIAHPFMVVTGYSRLSLRFHDYTSNKAWPREKPAPKWAYVYGNTRFGDLIVTETTLPCFYQIRHGLIAHTITVRAPGGINDAIEQALEWFSSLVELIPHSEVRA